jgi:hypothetical protein
MWEVNFSFFLLSCIEIMKKHIYLDFFSWLRFHVFRVGIDHFFNNICVHPVFSLKPKRSFNVKIHI